jgi:DNA polymerase-4
VNPHEVQAFLEELPIRKFYGVGKVTTDKMYQLGIFTGLDLRSKELEFLEKHFGKSGSFYYHVVRGIHNSEVKSERIAKSVAAEHTFEENLSSEIFMEEKLTVIAQQLEKRLLRNNLAGKTVTLKIKYSDFTQQTRSKTLPYFIANKALLHETAKELLYQERMRESVRLLGISVTNLNTEVKKTVVVQLRFDF